MYYMSDLLGDNKSIEVLKLLFVVLEQFFLAKLPPSWETKIRFFVLDKLYLGIDSQLWEEFKPEFKVISFEQALCNYKVCFETTDVLFLFISVQSPQFKTFCLKYWLSIWFCICAELLLSLASINNFCLELYFGGPLNCLNWLISGIYLFIAENSLVWLPFCRSDEILWRLNFCKVLLELLLDMIPPLERLVLLYFGIFGWF